MDNTRNDWLFTQESWSETTEVQETTVNKISPRVVFFDIETAPLRDVNNVEKQNWSIVIDFWSTPEQTQKTRLKSYANNNEVEKMWLYPEFAKVICVSVGAFDYSAEDLTTGDWKIIPNKRIKTLMSDDEKYILEEFAKVAEACEKLVWHNAVRFDAPFLMKRYIVNWMKVPKVLRWSEQQKWIRTNIKPRECKIEDTMKMRQWFWWISSSLETISSALWIPSPKENIDWSQVSKQYRSSREWSLKEKFEKDLTTYCEADVKATMEIYSKIVESYQ